MAEVQRERITVAPNYNFKLEVLKNFTSHDISFGCESNGGEIIIYKTYPSLGLARVKQENELRFISGEGIPVLKPTFGEPIGLPDPEPGVGYIVSRLVAEACPDRHDLYTTVGAIHDPETHRVVAALGVARNI